MNQKIDSELLKALARNTPDSRDIFPNTTTGPKADFINIPKDDDIGNKPHKMYRRPIGTKPPPRLETLRANALKDIHRVSDKLSPNERFHLAHPDPNVPEPWHTLNIVPRLFRTTTSNAGFLL
tara:strand:+ start:455 stop:823 length:369 start_codon:yes stop_codon:yes gene_type:complete